jgi:prepilin-type N-terminal cleavage/methylation domain-containing protein
MRRPQNVIRNRHGMSLVELLMALVVLLVVFFALMQTALVGIDSNMRNTLRGEAVNAAEIRMNEMRNMPFTGIVSDALSPLSDYDSSCSSGCDDCPSGFSTGKCICRDVKSIPKFKFCTNLRCSDFGAETSCATDDSDNRQITVTVGWKWKGHDYNHTITTIRAR